MMLVLRMMMLKFIDDEWWLVGYWCCLYCVVVCWRVCEV